MNKNYYFQQQFEPHKRGTPQAERDYERMMSGRQEFNGKRQGIKEKTKAQNAFVAGNIKGRNKRTVWNINTKPFKEAHFAVFPEALIETPIKAGCPPKGIVLDMFMGSGTTALVALKNNRNYVGIELNKEYIGMAEKRLSPYQNQKLGQYI